MLKQIPILLCFTALLSLNSLTFAEILQDEPLETPQLKDNTPSNILNNSEVSEDAARVIQAGKVELKQLIPKTPASTEIIEQKDFNKYENQNVTNVLKRSTSVNGVYGSRGETIFKFRGFNQRQVPVLLDGIPIYIPFDGVISLDRIPANNIQSIELIKSSPSVQYGPNTMGGVINIVTEKPQKPFELRARFNDNYVNTLNEDLYFGVNQKDFYFAFSHTFMKSHGFNMAHGFTPDLNENGGIRDNSAFHSLSLNTMLGYSRSDDQDIRLSYFHMSSPWNVPPEVGSQRARYWRFTKWRKNTAALTVKQPLFKKHLIFNGNLYYDKYFNVLNSFDDDSYTTQLKRYAFRSTYDDYSTGFNLVPEININRYVKLKPVYLYKRDTHREIGDIGMDKQKYKVSTTSLGGVIELYPAEKLTIDASISADHYNPITNNGNPLRDSMWAVNAQGGISYMITNNNKIYYTMGRKTRFPTLKELYSGFIGRNIPNPYLEPESALSYEVGFQNKFRDRTNLIISLYRSDVKNLIVDKPITQNLFQLQNISKVTQQGIDTNLTIDIIKNKLEYNAGYSFLHAVNRSENRQNNYLEYLPKHKFFTGLTAHLPLDIIASINFMYVSTVLYQDQQDLQWKKLGGYPVINAGLLKKFKEKVSIFVSIDNMLDKNYETEAHFPMPGISVNMGLKMEI